MNKQTKAYYEGGKRVSIGGVPQKMASWYGELGNDPEYRASRVRITPQSVKRYYATGIRRVINGVPYRLASKPITLKTSTARRFKQCHYENTAVISGHLAGLTSQREKQNEWFIMVKGKILEETITDTYEDYNGIKHTNSWDRRIKFDCWESATMHLMDVLDGEKKAA